jgi:divalent metal cation (Fe/Co/Zn/Cd) transporter
MTEKDINIEEEETLNEEPVDQTDKETEETAATEEADKEEEEEKDPLEKALEEAAELKNQLLYKAAEFENYRKRTLKERAELILNGGEKVITAILPVLDDMERAIANGSKTDDPQVLREGMELIYQKFVKTLEGQGVSKIVAVVRGGHLDVPGSIALWAALLSVAAKELIYRLTIRVSRKVDSPVLAANAWHHRTDALSSVAAAVGIGGALLFGGTWAILDPIAAVLVSVFILITAAQLLHRALQELLEQSLPADMEQQIREIVAADNELTGLHHLRTRRVGSVCSIEMHLRMPGDTSLYEAHRHSIELERRLRERFGQGTLITIHLEPLKDSR